MSIIRLNHHPRNRFGGTAARAAVESKDAAGCWRNAVEQLGIVAGVLADYQEDPRLAFAADLLRLARESLDVIGDAAQTGGAQ